MPADVEPIAVRLDFSGAGLGPGFVAFAEDRLRRLGLSGAARGEGAHAVVEAAGAAALVDMLEVACWLGPVESRVDAVVREALAEAAGT